MSRAVHEGGKERVDLIDRVHADVLAEHRPVGGDSAGQRIRVLQFLIGSHHLSPAASLASQFAIHYQWRQAVDLPEMVDLADEHLLVGDRVRFNDIS